MIYLTSQAEARGFSGRRTTDGGFFLSCVCLMVVFSKSQLPQGLLTIMMGANFVFYYCILLFPTS
ncbi:hypothetical protein B0I37DRAFT_384759 [Chaetomium sp. MPI-CAGE-AT-0009]|nr:hypothetical protein B0I37DRAFT_384759 [Chaetomium sp. MPI-CAGE-AT-0009]